MIVRLAVMTDYAGFSRVAQDVHEHHVKAIPDVFQSVDMILCEEEFLKLVHHDDSDVYVAESEQEIIGYAVLLHRRTTRDMHVPRTVAFIDNFGVLENNRGIGIGRKLFEQCVTRAKDMGAQTLELDCWEANQQAIQFYESMGMKLKRRWYSINV